MAVSLNLEFLRFLNIQPQRRSQDYLKGVSNSSIELTKATYCGMPKGTSQAEAMPKSEKIKPIALAVIELRQSEGIS